jgi:hypothetical protein
MEHSPKPHDYREAKRNAERGLTMLKPLMLVLAETLLAETARLQTT